LKIDFVVTHLSHSSPGSFYRPYEMAKKLQNHGFSSRILTPFESDVSYFSNVQMKKIPSSSDFLKISDVGYQAVRKFLNNKTLLKLFSPVKFIEKAASSLEKNIEKIYSSKPDIIQAEQDVAALACSKLSKKLGIPYIVDLHNVWGEELVSLGLISEDDSIYNEYYHLLGTVLEECNQILVVNDFMKSFIEKKINVSSKKIHVVPPGGEILVSSDMEKLNIERFKNKKFIYAGLVNHREHVDLFVKSIPYVKTQIKQCDFIIAEKGESIGEIKNLCRQLSVDPSFYWFNSRDDARNYIQKSIVGAMPSIDDLPRKLGTPLKLLEYLSLGIPVVANDIGSWCNIIQENNLGKLCSDDPKDFADAMLSLVEDIDNYSAIQKNGFEFIKTKHNWETIVTEKLIPVYQSLKD
jgi:glycosyltransferase involved in cell wall biosynthesis